MGRAAAARGLKLYQHNHSGEFAFATDQPSVRLYDVFLREHRPALCVSGDGRLLGLRRPVPLARDSNPPRTCATSPTATRCSTSRTATANSANGDGYDIVEFGAGDLPYEKFVAGHRAARQPHRHLGAGHRAQHPAQPAGFARRGRAQPHRAQGILGACSGRPAAPRGGPGLPVRSCTRPRRRNTVHRTLRRLITGVLLAALPALGGASLAPAAQAAPAAPTPRTRRTRARGRRAADPALDWANYEKITLTKDTGEPIDLAVLPDSRVLHTARNGDVRLDRPRHRRHEGRQPPRRVQNSRMACRPSPSTRTSPPTSGSTSTTRRTTLTAPYVTTTPTARAQTLPAGQTTRTGSSGRATTSLTPLQVGRRDDKLDLASEQEIIKVETQPRPVLPRRR